MIMYLYIIISLNKNGKTKMQIHCLPDGKAEIAMYSL